MEFFRALYNQSIRHFNWSDLISDRRIKRFGGADGDGGYVYSQMYGLLAYTSKP
jgi:hypothetical protein